MSFITVSKSELIKKFESILEGVENKHLLSALLVSAAETHFEQINQEVLSEVKSHIFAAVITETGQKGWKFAYTDSEGLNQHSGFYFHKKDAENQLSLMVSQIKEISSLKEELFEIVNSMNKPKVEETTTLHEIRNKLSPVCHLIAVVENNDKRMVEFLPGAIKNAKQVVNELAKREVFKPEPKNRKTSRKES